VLHAPPNQPRAGALRFGSPGVRGVRLCLLGYSLASIASCHCHCDNPLGDSVPSLEQACACICPSPQSSHPACLHGDKGLVVSASGCGLMLIWCPCCWCFSLGNTGCRVSPNEHFVPLTHKERQLYRDSLTPLRRLQEGCFNWVHCLAQIASFFWRLIFAAFNARTQ
jgi:hypothetical protein